MTSLMMSTKIRKFGVFLLLFSLFLGLATGNAGWAQIKHIVVDDRGQEIQVPDPVRRVVVAGTPLYTEVLVDLSATGVLVGITDSSENPPEVAQIPSVGPSFPSPNVELIVALQPDVVFGAVFDVRDQLEAVGLTVITPVGFIANIADLFALIRVVGLVVDRALAAELLVGQISEEIVIVEGVVAQETPKRAAFLFASADNPPFASGKGSLEGELLARAGAQNVFSDVAGGNVVSFEEIIERDPEVIFTALTQVENITNNPLLAAVTAVKQGQVFGINASSLTSTRVGEALRTMAQLLHPGAFK